MRGPDRIRATAVRPWLLVPALILLVLVFSERRANAGRNIVVLPMTSTSRSLQIYQKATSNALAQGLRRDHGLKVTVAASAKEVPANATVLIDGRLISGRNDRVKLEARVRVALTGQAVATIATDFAETTDIDSLVSSLASKLGPVLKTAMLPPAPIRLPTTFVKGSANQRPEAGAEQPTQQFAPPDILVVPAGGRAARGVVPVREPATSGALEMVARLGLQAVTSTSLEGVQNPVAAATESKRVGARFALMLEVRNVRFSYNAVLSARGTVRVVLLGHDGLAVIDKVVQTHTVVGSRGDRHQALVYRVAEQALDMLLRQLRSATEA